MAPGRLTAVDAARIAEGANASAGAVIGRGVACAHVYRYEALHADGCRSARGVAGADRYTAARTRRQYAKY